MNQKERLNDTMKQSHQEKIKIIEGILEGIHKIHPSYEAKKKFLNYLKEKRKGSNDKEKSLKLTIFILEQYLNLESQ